MPTAIFIPNINPLHFTQEGHSQSPQYNSKHIGDFQFEDTIKQWQQYVNWYQPYQKNDSIRLQFHSQISQIEAIIYDIDNVEVFRTSFQQMQQSFFNPTLFIYELDLALNILSKGYYKMKVTFGSPVKVSVMSNIFYVADIIDDSLLIEYSNYRHYADAYFENGWSPSVRIYGNLVYDKPGFKSTVFENQGSDMTLINNKPYDLWKLYTGGPEGIPDWTIRKYNLIIGCSNVRIDGRYYTKATESSGFDLREEKDYPMKGWSIDLRDKLNRTAKVWDASVIPGVPNNLGLTVVVNVETKGFVSDDQGGSYYEVIDVE